MSQFGVEAALLKPSAYPHDVDTPAGQRSERTVLGTSFSADAINNAVSPLQAGTIKALSLAHLKTLKVF